MTISLLSCLGTTFENVLAARLAKAVKEKGAITDNEMGSRADLSCIDTLMVTLTQASTWLDVPMKNTDRKEIRPSIVTQDVDRDFNCMIHDSVIFIMRHFRFLTKLVTLIANFNSGRSVYMSFNGQEETPSPFLSRVPQRSPISPILYLIYSTTLTPPPAKTRNELETRYVDDEVLPQDSKSIKFATIRLQEQTDEMLARAPYLHIKLAPHKSELIHLLPRTSQGAGTEGDTLRVGDHQVHPSQMIRSLGV